MEKKQLKTLNSHIRTSMQIFLFLFGNSSFLEVQERLDTEEWKQENVSGSWFLVMWLCLECLIILSVLIILIILSVLSVWIDTSRCRIVEAVTESSLFHLPSKVTSDLAGLTFAGLTLFLLMTFDVFSQQESGSLEIGPAACQSAQPGRIQDSNRSSWCKLQIYFSL